MMNERERELFEELFGKKEEKNINENVDPIQSYQQNVLAQMMRLRNF